MKRDRQLLVRLSGHSGAGKSRLVSALQAHGIHFTKTVLYTSRPPRPNERPGVDYHFSTSESIEELRAKGFVVGTVHRTLQAVDVDELASHLALSDFVLIEISDALWPHVYEKLISCRVKVPKLVAVFLTAVDPDQVNSLPRDKAAGLIRGRCENILRWRGTDSDALILDRCDAAVGEIFRALDEPSPYDAVIYSAPEGPDGEDEWTREVQPVGQAAKTLQRFVKVIME